MLLELVSKYKGDNKLLPVRSTKSSAGYDLRSAEDIVIPSYIKLLNKVNDTLDDNLVLNLEESQNLIKQLGIKPVLVPTGVRVKLPDNKYAGLVPRSSLPLKHLLVVINSEGIIDSDYYYADNEGHIHIMLVNLAPFDIKISKYDKLAQLIIKDYHTVDNDFVPDDKIRTGGFGSTGN